jgi:hypothetical protein
VLGKQHRKRSDLFFNFPSTEGMQGGVLGRVDAANSRFADV